MLLTDWVGLPVTRRHPQIRARPAVRTEIYLVVPLRLFVILNPFVPSISKERVEKKTPKGRSRFGLPLTRQPFPLATGNQAFQMG